MRVHALLLFLFLGITTSFSLIADTPPFQGQYDARRLQIIPADGDTEGYLTVEEDVVGAVSISHCTAQRVCTPLVSFPSYSRVNKSDFTLVVNERGKLTNRPYLKSGLILGAGVLGALEWSGIYEAMTTEGNLPYLASYVVGLPLAVGGVLVLGPPAVAVGTAVYATWLLANGPAYMIDTLSNYGREVGTFVTTGIYEMVKNVPSYAVRLVKERPVFDLGAWAAFGAASYAAYVYLNKSSTKTINFEKSYGGVITTSACMADLLDAIRCKESQSF